ncbi:MAG: class I SAM-dependent methyltransferase, partial [Lachnospiraceae bacterium]|nr:class I SAM-dependent methyltransferase [Lachnospiraceae bacterium]
IRNSGRPITVLNLFGYTGIASLACLRAGASVCHVDASKGMVSQAKRNAQLNGLEDRPCRWIVDDCMKFVLREKRRGRTYDAIIMDPPSYGRGPSGEVWRFEEDIYDLVKACAELLSDDPLFFTVNCYTTGVSQSSVGYLLSEILKSYNGNVYSDEIGIPVTDSGLILPCGNTSIFMKRV